MARFIKRGKSWQYEISTKDAETGKYKKIRKSGFSSKRDAIVEASEIESQVAKGFYAGNKDILLSEHFKQYIEVYKHNKVSDSTYHKYLNTLKVINRYFRHETIKSLNRIRYQSLLNEYAEDHSQESVRQFNTHIRTSLVNLLDDLVIKNDFTKGAIVKGGVKAKSESEKFLDYNDFVKLIKYAEDNIRVDTSSSFMIYLAAVTGMRFSELSGLTWDDIHFENHEISVNKTWNVYKNDFGETKNNQSKRIIAVDSHSIDLLTKYRSEQLKWLSGLPVAPQHSFVFYNARTGVISNAAANKQLKRFCEKLDIPKVTFHALRHSHASTLIYKGINILYISKRLGHSSLNVTMSVYSHILKELEEKDNENIRMIFEEI